MTPLHEDVAILIDGERVLIQGRAQYLVASKSVKDAWYSVEWDDDAMEWTCTCKSFECRHTCRHIKAISRAHGGTADMRIALNEWED